jgi:hypothetical protein
LEDFLTDKRTSDKIIADLIEGMNNCFDKPNSVELEKWSGSFKESIPSILAYACAIWTFMNSEFY